MFKRVVAALLFCASPSMADSDFGTKEEAKELASALILIIEAQGINAAASAVMDPSQPFLTSRMGVNLLTGSTIIADNREPETVAADYKEISDLTGEVVWPRIMAAAENNDDAMLKWYHYDTQEHYDYKCFSMKAERDEGLVMVCR